MERNIHKKIEAYNQHYKEFIKQSFIDVDKMILNRIDEKNITSAEVHSFIMSKLQSCYDYNKLSLNKDDFQKRKRVKNTVSICDRCCACRANKEQCTRRKREGSDYCGTHDKGVPHGIVEDQDNKQPTPKQSTVWAQDINGIMYYIDDANNVYKTEDVMKNIPNPRCIAKYELKDAVYTLV